MHNKTIVHANIILILISMGIGGYEGYTEVLSYAPFYYTIVLMQIYFMVFALIRLYKVK